MGGIGTETQQRSSNRVLIEQAVEIADGFYADQPIIWEDLLDRLEDWTGVDLGSDMTSPRIRLIQREVRKARRTS